MAFCSYETTEFGIYSSMRLKIKRRLCWHAIVLCENKGTYSKYSRLVILIVAETNSLFEKAFIDKFYVDLTGMNK